MKIEREMVKRFHKELNETLTQLGKKYNMNFVPKGLSFTDARITGRLELIAKGAPTADPRVTAFGEAVSGFPIGSTVKMPGTSTIYKITAYSSRGSASLIRLTDKKPFRAGPAQVAQFISAETGTPAMSREAIIKRMQEMMGQYSIEAVSADGERSSSGVQQMRREGRREWDKLRNLLGRCPTMKEMYPDLPAVGSGNESAEPEGL